MVDRLLKAPCKVCGYNGKGYWQKGTHKKWCFFYNIGGDYEREQFVLKDWPHNQPLNLSPNESTIKTCGKCGLPHCRGICD